jgi:hypothetical protein
MAEAALKYDEFEDFDDIEPVQIPAGGIATFLTAREGMFADDDDDELPSGGIASVKQVADKLAEYGRHEDEYMVHAAEGETVIPMEVFRKNPILKENIFRQMRDMGLEPERYIVGNELNSINPVTGQPEFFLKKLFKKLGKFLKKAVSVVLPIVGAIFLGPLGASLGSGIATLIQGGNLKDAFKAAALSGLTAGAMNAIGGGISAVKEGGTFLAGAKEGALGSGGFTRTFAEATAAGKAAGATAAQAAADAVAAEGLAAAGGPSIDVGATLGTGKPAALAANKLELLSTELTKRGVDGNTIQQIVNDGFSKGLTVDQMLVGQGIKYDPAVFIAGQGMTGTAAEQVAAREAVLQSGTPRPGGSGIALEKIDGIDVAGTQLPGAPTITEEGGFIVETYPDGRKVSTLKGYDPKPLGEAVGTATEAATTTTTAAPLEIQVEKFLETGQVKTPGVMDSLRKLGPGGDDFGEGLRDLFMPGRGQRVAAENMLVEQFGEGVRNLPKFSQYVDKLMGEGPNFLRRFGPGTIAAMGIGNLVSPSENPELPDMSQEGISQALTLLEENPEQYRSFQNLAIRGGGQFSPFEIKPLYNDPLGTTTYQSVADVATGGGMNIEDFPPRMGAISGPGTETSDDIPAMLSDGEFVMTAEAVRGAGNGSREAGMRNMYQMMNQFEAMA